MLHPAVFEGMNFPVQVMDMEAAKSAVDSPGSICVLYAGSTHGEGHYTRYTKGRPRAAAAPPTQLAIAGARMAAPPVAPPKKKGKEQKKKPKGKRKAGGGQQKLPFGKKTKGNGGR